MARTKQKKLSKLIDFKNVFNIKQPDIKDDLRNFFRNKNNFTLEIGCGHGDYSIELAKLYPERNFIGIDVKGARIHNGAMNAINLQLDNVAFIISKAEWLNKIFEPNSIEEIYIPFPEPHLKPSIRDRRLISSPLLNIYKKLIVEGGLLHFKTDNDELYQYAIKNILDSGGTIIYSTEYLKEAENLKYSSGIITNFENHYVKAGKTIKYICFIF